MGSPKPRGRAPHEEGWEARVAACVTRTTHRTCTGNMYMTHDENRFLLHRETAGVNECVASG